MIEQLMGGSIQVESKKHEGSRFTMTIPFQLVSDNGPMVGKQILLVEDNDLSGDCKTMLEMNGAFEEVKKKAFDIDVTGYLVKPLDVKLLTEKLLMVI